MTDLGLSIAGWLLLYLVHSTLLLGAVAIIDRLRLVASPALREHLWRAALVGALITSGAQLAGLPTASPRALLALGAADAPAPPAAETLGATLAVPLAPTAPRATADGPAPEWATSSGAGTTIVSTATPPAAAPRRLPRPLRELAENWPALLLLIWALGAFAALVRLATLALIARRELAPRRPAGPELVSELDRLCLRHGVSRPALSISHAIASPISLPQREIVLPPWALTALDPEQRRALLAHELAHQARRDPHWILFALLLDAILWLQPLLRLARRRLSALAEIQADTWAARAAGNPRALANCLVECAERLLASRHLTRGAAHFGAAMAAPGDSTPLLDRIERLTKGTPMPETRLPWFARGAVLATLALSAFVLPGCGIADLRAAAGGFSSNTSIDADGDMRMSVTRPGYKLKLRVDGEMTFADDESDVATLEPGGKLRLEESLDGVKRAIEITPEAGGALTHAFEREGREAPFDAEARQWLAEALPRMFRESGFDAEARVGRLLARGGVNLVLSEVELTRTDFARGSYLGNLLAQTKLSPTELDRAIAAMGGIDSDFELRRALSLALDSQEIDAERFTRLLDVAAAIESDFERSELLVQLVDRLPASPTVRSAWLASAAKLGSDFELSRALSRALEASVGDDAFVASILALATAQMDSDFELRQTMERVRGRASAPAVASAYLDAVESLDSDFERGQALVGLLKETPLDAALLGRALAATMEIDSSFERLGVLTLAAPKVAGDPELNRKYREIARSMNDFERGQALAALDDAVR